MKPAPVLFLVLLLAACSPASSPAQATQSAAATGNAAASTQAEEAGFLLTRGNVDAFFNAQPLLAAAVEDDPSLDPAMDLSEEDAAAFAARLEASPALRGAIARAGLSTHDYARTSEQLLGALMAQGAMDAGLLQDLPEGISRRNVEFVRTHRAEIDARVQALRG
ncbi:hypothetical protein E2F46_04230 [Luteimonas aestuarii]|uniref:DUF4142 domain-containing protein n=1 Tax=Luteimonas aestuarii TaxID=453837 RepID=A0A4V3AN11_9GAMM|nr:hypothetical protein [Luteimonas aestuarii]TDK27403.1 hypothetical protein E2F46_04230 [Luteimonas aestuarii]